SSEMVPPTVPPAGESAPQDDPASAEEEEAEGEPSSNPAPPAGGADLGDHPEQQLQRRDGGTKSETGPAGQDALSLEEIQRLWPAVLQKLGETAPALASALEGARPVSFGDSGLEVGFPADMKFLKKNVDSPEKRDTVAAAFAAVTGTGLRPTYVLLEGEAPPDTPAPGSGEIDEDQILKTLESEFDAEEVS
ncbi:MAG TPA: hypothetical protein VNM38_02215, partial [Solirubrobacterales bacterium]|nr:hypothetical protein [Solirubrobacterales bacterium]